MTRQAGNDDARLGGFSTAMVAIVALACFHASVSAAEDLHEGKKTLLMGVFPIVSGVALFKRFAPLKDYLASELGRELVLETARDFPTFVQRTTARRYDIVITAPHFSLLAADSGDYRIVARSKRDLVSLIVVSKTSAITDLAQLAGQVIATPPASALVTQYGKDYLAEKGLKDEKGPKYRAYKSHNAAYQAVLVGHATAALVSNNAINKALDKGVPLRVIDTLPLLPNMPILVATDLPKAFAQQVERVLVTMEDTDEGRAVLKEIDFPGYWPSGVEDYKPVRPYKPADTSIGSQPVKVL
jgi:phosphonate transport system substrate-binding protein